MPNAARLMNARNTIREKSFDLGKPYGGDSSCVPMKSDVALRQNLKKYQ